MKHSDLSFYIADNADGRTIMPAATSGHDALATGLCELKSTDTLADASLTPSSHWELLLFTSIILIGSAFLLNKRSRRARRSRRAYY
jgi:hypothetical protein